MARVRQGKLFRPLVLGWWVLLSCTTTVVQTAAATPENAGPRLASADEIKAAFAGKRVYFASELNPDGSVRFFGPTPQLFHPDGRYVQLFHRRGPQAGNYTVAAGRICTAFRKAAEFSWPRNVCYSVYRDGGTYLMAFESGSDLTPRPIVFQPLGENELRFFR